MSVQSTVVASITLIPKTALRPFEKLLTGIVLTCAVSLVTQEQGLTHSSEVPATKTLPANVVAVSHAATNSMSNGTYLYGQAPKAGQLGATYLVFEVNKGNVTGAFYMPRSSFDCVHGTLQAQQLALTVVNSYEQASYPYAVALQSSGTSASLTQPNVTPISLKGYYPIKQLSAGDRRLLSTCKASR
ncbi:hypothetical protein H6F86_15190 [Phormidium sp. FACHB-592]|uniref:CHRD domain-containing protein n=1 Tax=Stenomitos frigidus AS-A4 TaxID=2933935 RepID=A0ABV0KS69_9CYAN|nr:hypothetical protein [Phormidium sp. FACHB-592]MBD2075216.1 hypothetical protein [Phormidium sp. FACHB-592]